MAQTVKVFAYNVGNWVGSLGWEDPLEKEMATHASTLAWKIPWTEEPGRLGRLQSMGSQRVGHELSDFAFTFYGITATSSKRTYTIMLHLPRLLLLVTLTLSQATVDPGFRQRLQTLTGESGSVFWGVSALVPGCWCTQGFVCALQESVFSQS